MTQSVGLIGAGGIGRTHAENLRATAGASLVAVCNLDRHGPETHHLGHESRSVGSRSGNFTPEFDG